METPGYDDVGEINVVEADNTTIKLILENIDIQVTDAVASEAV